MTVAACGDAEQRRVLVFAAASLRDVLTELAVEYEVANEVDIAVHWGGSVALANQLKRNAPGDVFISAGAGPMDDLEENGLLAPESRTTLASNNLVLAVSSDTNPTSQPLEQTLRDAGRIAMADPALSPAGVYARESLQNMRIWDELHDRIVLGSNVRTALAYVESGAAEAGIVYRTDAVNNEGVRIAYEMPSASHSPILYPAALLKDSRNQPEASPFLAFLKEEYAQSRFQARGFNVGDWR